ncbi:glycerol kinase GlpK [Sphingomicrobium sp. XHP0235]|uniref:FGGY family carbohydrate kinase n=1 Tax=Sphingomicrobium aquimarinum TaxID=3133971 RepID=UPI0031FE7F94
MILVIDAGTSSVRALLFDVAGDIHFVAQAPIASSFPMPGRVEQDADAIWQQCRRVLRDAIEHAGGAQHIEAMGITNQRETVVAWDRRSGAPLGPAIVWQDRRTSADCATLVEAGNESRIQEATGLVLDPYFSATKMAWMMRSSDAVRSAAETGRLSFGTIESWLLFKLTGGHLSDASNASRTSLMGIETRSWERELCDLFGIPVDTLPRIVPMHGDYGSTHLFGAPIAITGSAGDQQAATIGQGCLAPGAAKATFGTGLFALASTGADRPRSSHRLLSTLLYSDGEKATYALEGSVFVAGSLVTWLRDMAGLVESGAETETLARSVENAGGVTIIPAFVGLGAPHWRADLEGSIHGLTFGVTRAHLVRAALEAVTMSARDLAAAFAADGAPWQRLRVDGGMVSNDWLTQDLADMLALDVERPVNIESTARGAAMLAALGAGLFGSIEEATAAMLPAMETFPPALDETTRQDRARRWSTALEKALARP